MEDTTLKAMMLAVDVFIFVAAVTVGVILSTTVNKTIDLSFNTLDRYNKDIIEVQSIDEATKKSSTAISAEQVYSEVMAGIYQVKVNNTLVNSGNINRIDFNKTYKKSYVYDNATSKMTVSYIAN